MLLLLSSPQMLSHNDMMDEKKMMLYKKTLYIEMTLKQIPHFLLYQADLKQLEYDFASTLYATLGLTFPRLFYVQHKFPEIYHEFFSYHYSLFYSEKTSQFIENH